MEYTSKYQRKPQKITTCHWLDLETLRILPTMRKNVMKYCYTSIMCEREKNVWNERHFTLITVATSFVNPERVGITWHVIIKTIKQ